jgi:hypothetical protein
VLHRDRQQEPSEDADRGGVRRIGQTHEVGVSRAVHRASVGPDADQVEPNGSRPGGPVDRRSEPGQRVDTGSARPPRERERAAGPRARRSRRCPRTGRHAQSRPPRARQRRVGTARPPPPGGRGPARTASGAARVAEVRDGRDRALAHGQHLDGVRLQRPSLVDRAIDGERRLGVRGRGHEPEVVRSRAARRPDPVEERTDRCMSRVPVRPWRHGDDRVLPEKGDEPVQVGGLPDPEVPAEQLALPLVLGRQDARAGRRGTASRSSPAPAGARCSPTSPRRRGAARSRPPTSPSRPGEAAPPAGVGTGAGWPPRRRAARLP